MGYQFFSSIFEQLSARNQTIILNLLRNLDHINDSEIKKLNYKEGFKAALLSADMTIDDLCEEVAERNHTIPENVKDAVVSLLYRTYRNSIYYKDVLEILSVNETELEQHSSYIKERFYDKEWLFNSISDRDKYAVNCLIIDLLAAQSPVDSPSIDDSTKAGNQQESVPYDDIFPLMS